MKTEQRVATTLLFLFTVAMTLLATVGEVSRSDTWCFGSLAALSATGLISFIWGHRD